MVYVFINRGGIGVHIAYESALPQHVDSDDCVDAESLFARSFVISSPSLRP